MTTGLLADTLLRADMTEPEVVVGVVDEALPNTLFRVKLENGKVMAYRTKLKVSFKYHKE